VFIDRSNYEDDPLGRCEWIKIYGLLTGKEQEAAGVFDQQKTVINSMGDMEDLNKSVLVFSINANHMVNVKTENDYLAKMIEIAGGNYLSFDVPGVNNMSNQAQITMEAFYDCASEADVLIYNSTIETAPSSIQELIDNEKLFTDFKAVRNGNVWYTDKSMYQFADKTGSIIVEMNQIISGEQEDTSFFHKLR
jgi:iron complex transport system substrate-binding protein